MAGRPKGSAPYAWKFKDPFDHERHVAYGKAKAQADFRGEGWELTLDEWFQIWDRESWSRRGRGSLDLCMVRIDRERPFSFFNVKLVERFWQIARDKKSHIGNDRERPI